VEALAAPARCAIRHAAPYSVTPAALMMGTCSIGSHDDRRIVVWCVLTCAPSVLLCAAARIVCIALYSAVKSVPCS
jgi:hypothetical protein